MSAHPLNVLQAAHNYIGVYRNLMMPADAKDPKLVAAEDALRAALAPAWQPMTRDLLREVIDDYANAERLPNYWISYRTPVGLQVTRGTYQFNKNYGRHSFYSPTIGFIGFDDVTHVMPYHQPEAPAP